MDANRIIAAILIVLVSLSGWAAIAHASDGMPPLHAVSEGASEHCDGEGHASGDSFGDAHFCCFAVLSAVVAPAQDCSRPLWAATLILRPAAPDAPAGLSQPIPPRPPRA